MRFVSRKVSETKAHRAGRVPESDGWSAWGGTLKPMSAETRDLECWKGTGKASLEVKDG